MKVLSPSVWAREARKGLSLFVLTLSIAIIVAICQSIKFASSFWVIAEFGYLFWQEYITRILEALVVWAIVTGAIFAIQAPIGNTTKGAKVITGIISNFAIGFAFPYILVIMIGIALYIPLGILSFVIPHSVHFASMGFALLCSAYIVFLWIAVDTPLFLAEIIKKAPLHFRLFGLLLSGLLAVQILSMILSIFSILIKNSVWRIHLPAFIIAFGVTLCITLLINLALIKEGSHFHKVMSIVSVYILSIITGNLSEQLFHWGEYASAITAAIPGAIVYSVTIHKLKKDIISTLSAVAGLIVGFGMGLAISNMAKLKIVGQGLIGIFCGTAFVLVFGICFGFILGPQISMLLANLFQVKPKTSYLLGIGSLFGIIIGVVIGEFINRQ